jgi:iron complex transport system ATP-binding protein
MVSCDIAHLADRTFGSLSGGEQARAVLARTLAQETPVLLLDEPTAALDLQHQTMVGRALRERADAGRAVIMVVHDLTFAAAYADRIAVLSEGSLVVNDVPERALTAELLGQVYRQRVEVVRSPKGALVVVPVDVRPQATAWDQGVLRSSG